MVTASAPGEGAPGRTPRGRALFSGLARSFAAEREQWPLWVPVAVGAGVAAYFGLPIEPPLWPAAAIATVGFALAWLLRGRPVWPLIALGLALAAAGCLAAELRTRMVAAPALGDDVGPVEISGRILETEPLPNGRRLLLGEVAIEGLPASATPARVRVRVNRIEAAIGPGDRVRLLASLTPPSAPFAPGAYDFQRDAYFQEIGAVGFALGPPTLLASADPSLWRGFSLWIARLREAIGERIRAAIPDRAGPVAAALVVGSQTGIDKSVMEAMRDSGLAHLL
jgi:competence protein ComEC